MPRIDGEIPDRLVQHEARLAARRLGLRPALHPDRHVRVVVVLEIIVHVPGNLPWIFHRAGDRREGEVRRIDSLPIKRIGRTDIQRLHRERRTVPPRVGFAPFRRFLGHRAGCRIRDFNGLEGKVQRFLALGRTRRGVVVCEVDCEHALQRVIAVILQRDFELVEGLVGCHDVGIVAAVDILNPLRLREQVWILRVDVLDAADAELVVRAGAGGARHRHALEERIGLPVKSTRIVAIPPRAPFGRTALPRAAKDLVVEVGRHVFPVDLLGITVGGPPHAVPFELDVPAVVDQLGLQVLRRRIRAGVFDDRQRPARRGIGRGKGKHAQNRRACGQSPSPKAEYFCFRHLQPRSLMLRVIVDTRTKSNIL